MNFLSMLDVKLHLKPTKTFILEDIANTAHMLGTRQDKLTSQLNSNLLQLFEGFVDYTERSFKCGICSCCRTSNHPTPPNNSSISIQQSQNNSKTKGSKWQENRQECHQAGSVYHPNLVYSSASSSAAVNSIQSNRKYSKQLFPVSQDKFTFCGILGISNGWAVISIDVQFRT